MERTMEIVELLKDLYGIIEGDSDLLKKCSNEKYFSKLSKIIDESNSTGNNMLMTQKECLYFYKSDCKNILKLKSQLKQGGASKDYLEGFTFAIDCFRGRNEF